MTDEKNQFHTNVPESETISQDATHFQEPEAAPTDTSAVPVDSEIVEEVPAESSESATDALVTSLTQERDTLAQQIADRDQQLDAFKQRYITLAAEFDNFRKRSQREKQDIEIQAKCKTLGELLAVVDNFERARTQIKPANEGEVAIHKSYQGVYKSLVDSLKRLGVAPMRPEGQAFDPAYHEAMLREYTDEYPEGTVIEELVRGYLIGDQVLRHAMVKVAAAPDADTPASEPSSAQPEPSMASPDGE